jgi:hypothetical protein
MLRAVGVLPLFGALGPHDVRPGEPELRRWFGVPDDAQTPWPIQRFSNISAETVSDLVSRGVPFVVEDGGRDHPMKTWDCGYFATEFQDGRFRREYGGGGEKNQEKMETKKWISKLVPIKGSENYPEGSPRFAPFYWDIVKAARDEPERGWGQNYQAHIAKIQGATKVPYFLKETNLNEMKNNPEFWIQPPTAGSQAHLDEHCISTIATTLSGAKKWRLQLVPPEPNANGYFDGLIYKFGEWAPMWETVLRPGETIVFPPVMVHEGLSVGEECHASVTYQFRDPAPSGLFRAFWPRIRHTPDMQNCHRHIQHMSGFGGKASDAKELAERLDKDGDGLLSPKELRSADTFRFHDANLDGRVEISEFVENANAFKAASSAKRKVKKKGPEL